MENANIPASTNCLYPASHATKKPIREMLDEIAANKNNCTSFYLDTTAHQSNDTFSTEGEDHHQGLARTHKLSDGSVYFFLTHSELDDDDQGILMQFRYGGPTSDEHILQTLPLTIAPLKQTLFMSEQHPSAIEFLPDVNNADAGYLFITEEMTNHRVAIYFWERDKDLRLLGHIFQGFPQGSPNFIFIDKVDDMYYLGIASNNTGWGKLYCAKPNELFPVCKPGNMNIHAFKQVVPESLFPFPVLGGPCQVKLIRDSLGIWYLLAYRSDPPDDPHGTDYIDTYRVEFSPFSISYRTNSVHIFLKPGETGFANTGTHVVERSGRLLVASSYRWSKKEGGSAGYVSRVDECPSF